MPWAGVSTACDLERRNVLAQRSREPPRHNCQRLDPLESARLQTGYGRLVFTFVHPAVIDLPYILSLRIPNPLRPGPPLSTSFDRTLSHNRADVN